MRDLQIDELLGVFESPLDELPADGRRWILESTFYLLAGKLLADKGVKTCTSLAILIRN